MMTNVIAFDDNRGGLAYPFLLDEWQWQITARPLAKRSAEQEDGLDLIFEAEQPSHSAGSEPTYETGSGATHLTSLGSAQAARPEPTRATGSKPTPSSFGSAQDGPEPTLRWVKDDKVLDLIVPGMDTAAFLERTGLQLSLDRGGYVLSKRLSRIMRPYRYWGLFAVDEVVIDYNEHLDPQLWDGSGLVSRRFIQRLADSLYPSTGSGQVLDERHRRELLHSSRFEVTTLHAAGQDKAHVLVVDDDDHRLLAVDGTAADFMFPAGSVKQELALAPSTGSIFIGLSPVHGDNQMRLDVQSLVNLYPFFQPEHLLAWAGMESALFLNSIRTGKLDALLNRLYDARSAADLDSLAGWHVGEYIASGGQLMWFAGMVKAAGRQHLKRLGSNIHKLRAPIPGGRQYIFPAAVGERNVPEGCIEIDPDHATAWVNDIDWRTFIVNVLGGCDGDDALWLFPFTDISDGQRKVLVWRSPNQLGEYVILKPTAASHNLAWDTLAGPLAYPKMDSRRLPPRIDTVAYEYGKLAAAGDEGETGLSYSIEALQSTIERAAANQGTLGGFCNTALLCKAIYGRLPQRLPATLEDVIDGSVKTGLDLTPVQAWMKMALKRMVKHGQQFPSRAVPRALRSRLPEWLATRAVAADSHWLDTLAAAMEQHREQYWAEVEALACEACPPLALFEHGRDWMQVGKELRQAYSRVIRQIFDDRDDTADDAAWDDDSPSLDKLSSDSPLGASFDNARSASEAFLNRWPADNRNDILIGAAAYLYMLGPQVSPEQGRRNGEPVRDALIWQLGPKREKGSGRAPGIAQMMLTALRRIGLLGEPVWKTDGAVLHYRDAPASSAGVPVRISGVWFNLLRATQPDTPAQMSLVPRPQRELAKARIADYVQDRFRGMLLTTEVTDNNRVITRTPHGNLFGYVQRDHELAAVRHDQWRIAWAHVIDGNVQAILQPISESENGAGRQMKTDLLGLIA